jgi:ABC-type uncharacterized transport system permease subunit
MHSLNILKHDTLFALGAILYLVLSVYFWRSRWRSESTRLGTQLTSIERALIALAITLHGTGLYLAVFSLDNMRFSFALAISLMLWLACLVYWIEGLHIRLEAIQPLVLGPAAVSAALPLLAARSHPIAFADSLGFRLHFSAAMLAYSLFALAFLQALLLRFAERKLHRRDLSRGLITLPPVLALESLLFRMVTVAFALLTFAVASGLLFSEVIYGKAWRLDHKTVFALLSWGIFAGLLLGRWRAGWRGKTAQRWLAAGFVALVLAYVGSRFVAEVLLGR